MPKLKTNEKRNVVVVPNPEITEPGLFCTASYDDYLKQRVEVEDFNHSEVQDITEVFHSSISNPVHVLNPLIEMGEYFVIPVRELREMLDHSGDNPEFIHVCNGLRSVKNSAGDTLKFPVTVLVPYERVKGEARDEIRVCERKNSVYIEAYPCPPDPRCPKAIKNAKENIFPDSLELNSFNSLF